VASTKAFVILDGTLLPIDQNAADRPFYSGKHEKHGMNVQISADPARATGVGIACTVRRGPRHQGRPNPRHHRRPGGSRRGVLGRQGYRGAGGTVRLPYWGRWETLPTGQQAVNRSHARIRALVEQAMATLKTWRIPRKLRCSTTRITSLVQAVLTLHLTWTKPRRIFLNSMSDLFHPDIPDAAVREGLGSLRVPFSLRMRARGALLEYSSQAFSRYGDRCGPRTGRVALDPPGYLHVTY
jgi:hypothetical protein